MTGTQLILLALTCINENREPSHTEQSRIYIFYKTAMEDKNTCVNKVLISLKKSVNKRINIQKRQLIFDFISVHINNAAIKSGKRNGNGK